MSEILAVESTGKGKPASIKPEDGGDIVSHFFEIRTANVDYFIGRFDCVRRTKIQRKIYICFH